MVTTPKTRHRLFYDEDDYRLLEIVKKLIERGQSPKQLRKLFDPGLHPHGIKELAAPKSLRIASAMIDLLGTFDRGTAQERLTALRAVRAETLHDSTSQAHRLNVARVLMQIMKEIVRASGDEARQLALCHDFRNVASGKPRLIRQQLRRYHLLEMPREWNQLAFDHHVHDANTKGRKSPTHLIMDAWIKGIRFLGVIYYNHVKIDAAAELLEAAEIMGIEVRIGIEVQARLRDKYVQLIWSPRGFLGREDFLRFLEEPEVRAFMAQGQEVVEYEKRRIIQILHSFNDHHLPRFNETHGLDVPPLDENEFLESVGCGQPSLVHLAEYAHQVLSPHLKRRIDSLRKKGKNASPAQKQQLLDLLDAFHRIDPETLVEEYLRPEDNPSVGDFGSPIDGAEIPKLLRMDPETMLDTLESLPCRSRITLNPSNLTPADVLDVLYAGRGRITHIEIYNAKDWAHQRTQHRFLINEIRLVINSGNAVEAKRMIRNILADIEEDPTNEAVAQKLREILGNIRTLLGFYNVRRLRSRLGSDSIGHARHSRGMGLVVIPTLPWRARREINRDPDRLLPASTVVRKHVITTKSGNVPVPRFHARRDSAVEFLIQEPHAKEVRWSVGRNTTTLAESGNIGALGGKPQPPSGDVLDESSTEGKTKADLSVASLNSWIKNISKIVIGFIPAFLTFYLSKDWWLLAYFGAIIWFGITGFRNIIQSVIGGGGLRHSSLLAWKDFVSWGRVADSLLFTGFSVPLLDYLVKSLLLAQGLGITTATNPLALYTIIALANGLYISSHNAYRGLPLGAVVGNFFRTILSIPVAIGLNFLILKMLTQSGVSTETALAGMQMWAAVISKTASDFVAAIIEGSADRHQNLSLRRIDYREKLVQVYDVYARLETTFQDQDVLTLLGRTEDLVQHLQDKDPKLLRDMVIDALDLLYFWMYQPRARIVLARKLKQMSSEEKQFFVKVQEVLIRKRLVSEMLLNGLLGKRFEPALAFYLSHSDRYLHKLAELASRS